MDTPKISIIMPVCNREQYLDETIQSVLNQTFSDFEFIIIDDSSTDSSMTIIKKYQETDRRIKIFKNKYKKGIVGALNTGIGEARGVYIARMDSDDICLPKRLEKQVSFLEKNLEISACGAFVELFGTHNNIVWKLPTDSEDIKSTMIFCGAIANPTGMFRREVFTNFKFSYDESFVVAEDYDFWVRISRKIKLANIPEVLLMYRVHYSNTGTVYSKEHLEGSNEIRKRQLLELGLNPTQKEITIHQKIGNGDFIGGKDAIDDIESWSQKLINANNNIKIFNQKSFNKIVTNKKNEAIELHRKNSKFNFKKIIIFFITFTGKLLRLFLSGKTVDRIYHFALKTYGELEKRRIILISKTEKYQVWLGICTKMSRMVKKKYKIGMAILAHERPQYLELCLDSLFRTKLYDYDITFLIIDDGSKDKRVKEIIERKVNKEYKIIRKYTSKGHNSWAGAFNKAIRSLIEIDDFDIIGTCDSDALFHPEWLDKTMKIALWAKRNHRHHVLGPFSSFNSSDSEFHKILGIYESPYGKYVVKERMGALNYFYFKKDFLKLGYYPESKDDETIMTEKFKKLRVRYFSTETSYVEHIGQLSVLNKWRPVPVDMAVYGVNLARGDWGINLEKISPYAYYRYVKESNSFGNIDRSSVKVDVVIPVIKKDLNVLPVVVKYLRKNLLHSVGKIIIVSPGNQHEIKDFCKKNNCDFKDEDFVLPIKKKDINYMISGRDRSGWIFQQLIKLNVDNISNNEYIYIIDADTVLIQPQKFEKNGRTILLISDEFHTPYHNTYEKIFKQKTFARFSFIAHQMLVRNSFLSEIKKEIEEKNNNKSWYQVILDNLDKNENSSFSEYETYGNWVMQNHPEEIEMEYWFNKSLSKNKLRFFSLNFNKYAKIYRSISFHSYNKGMISKIFAYFS